MGRALSPSGSPRIDDSWLYDDETIRVGTIIHGSRVCSGCGTRLPASTDYFTPSRNGNGDGTLKSACRRCVRERYRDTDRVRAKARRAREKT